MDFVNSLYPVILSGGSGTRLWPQSRSNMPKQFVSLIGDNTLFGNTLKRLTSVTENSPIIVTNEEHRFLVAEELRFADITDHSILLEPTARNTAPAIALAAFRAMELNKDAMLLVCPADHLIDHTEAFKNAVYRAFFPVEQNKIVAFGCKPERPETGYGYIQVEDRSNGVIEKFIEKPSQKKANEYFSEGNYFWNSGIFMFKASVFLKELKEHSEEIYSSINVAWESHKVDGEFTRVSKKHFFSCPSDSIDYAIMEKTRNAAMVELDCEWKDLGSWESIWQTSEKDLHGNANNGDVHFKDSSENYVHSQNKLVTLLGCHNLIVIDSGDALLVADRKKSQDVKDLVNELRLEKREEVVCHPRVYRPWGDYEGIDQGQRYQVKRIVVKPGEKLSLQMHHHRAEHWTVVRGTALVTCGEEKILLTENQSTYIPLGEIHRLENPGSITLELIEVQSGSYLGEDDIVRLEDKYGRRKDDKPVEGIGSKLHLVSNSSQVNPK